MPDLPAGLGIEHVGHPPELIPPLTRRPWSPAIVVEVQRRPPSTVVHDRCLSPGEAQAPPELGPRLVLVEELALSSRPRTIGQREPRDPPVRVATVRGSGEDDLVRSCDDRTPPI